MELRSTACEQGLLSNANGSVRYSQGTSCVLVAVYGPKETRTNLEQLERCILEVSVLPRIGVSGTREKRLERQLRNSFETVILTTQYPRTSIEIVVQIISDDGSILSTILNGVTLALFDAAVQLKSSLIAVSCCFLDGAVHLDPAQNEEEKSPSAFTFAFLGGTPDVLLSHAVGSFSDSEFMMALHTCQAASEYVLVQFKASLERRVKIDLPEFVSRPAIKA